MPSYAIDNARKLDCIVGELYHPTNRLKLITMYMINLETLLFLYGIVENILDVINLVCVSLNLSLEKNVDRAILIHAACMSVYEGMSRMRIALKPMFF